MLRSPTSKVIAMGFETSQQRVRLIRLAEKRRLTGPGTSSAYAPMSRGEFPQRGALNSGTAVGCVESEIQEDVLSRIAQREQSVAMRNAQRDEKKAERRATKAEVAA
jgi:predicted DNA-binding transcriptional regulator AlpA